MIVTNGVRRLRGVALVVAALLVVLGLGGCGTGAPPSKTVAKVVITPGALLFTGAGATGTLTAQALDANGAPIDATIRWASSDATVVEVDDDGTVTTNTELGSALVTASADGVDSFPTSIVVAQPVAGTVLLSDDEVAEPPTPVDGTSDPIRQRVVLTGVNGIEPGTVILGSQAISIGGRIEQVTPTTDGLSVVYAPMPPQDLFQRLSIDQDFDLAPAPIEPAAWLADHARITSPSRGTSSLHVLDALGTQSLGEICKFESMLVSVSSLTTTFENHLHFHLHLQDGVADPDPTQVYVDGKISQKTTSGLTVQAGFNDTVTCNPVLFRVPIPIGGVSALVARPEIPIGVALSVSGSITGAGVSVNVETNASLDLKAGFTNDAVDGFTLLHDVTPTSEAPSAKVDLITPSHLRVGASAFVGLASGVDLKVAGLDDISLVQAQLGPKQSLDLASGEAQADSNVYASSYDLAVTGTVGMGADLSKFLSWLKIHTSVQPWQVQVVFPLAHSPSGTFTVSQTDAVPGDKVHLRVALDSKNLSYLGHYNVSKVEIYRAKGSEEPSLYRTIEPNSSNQSVFEMDWDTTGLQGDDYRFYAFVIDDLLAKAAEVPLEVTEDSKQVVHLAGSCTAARAGTPAVAPTASGSRGYGTQAVKAQTSPLLSACTGGTTWDYSQPSEANGVAWEVHTTGSDLIFRQDSGNPKLFNLTGATVSWTDEAVYGPGSPSSCTIESSGSGLRVTNTDPNAGAYVSGIIMLLDDGTYTGTGYVYVPDGASDGCHGGTVAESVPLFTTGTPSPTPQSDGHGGSLFVGSSTGTNDVNGVTTTTWSFDFPDLPPPSM